MHRLTEKGLLLQQALFVITKNVGQKKRHGSDDHVRLALFLYLLHKRTQVLITFQHYLVTQRLVVHSSVGNKTKSIRPRPKRRDQDEDRGRPETGLLIRPRSQTPRLMYHVYTPRYHSITINLPVSVTYSVLVSPVFLLQPAYTDWCPKENFGELLSQVDNFYSASA